MVPMTLISFIEARPPAAAGAATTAMCTTVSTACPLITLAMTGLRMSARTKAAAPRSYRGGVTSTPTTVRSPGAARVRATRAARPRETPVTRTTRAIAPLRSRLLAGAAALDARALEQLAVLLLRHPLAALLDDRTHEQPLDYRDAVGLGLLRTRPVCRRTTLACYPARRTRAQPAAGTGAGGTPGGSVGARGPPCRGRQPRIRFAQHPPRLAAQRRAVAEPGRGVAVPAAPQPPRAGGAPRGRRRLGHRHGAVALGARSRRRPRRRGARPADLHERAVPLPHRPAVRARREPHRRPPPHLRPPRLGRGAGAAALRRRRVGLPGLAERHGGRRRHGQPAGQRVRRHRGPATRARTCCVVRVHQWSAASYLEDQDQWWLPGIFRERHAAGPARSARSTTSGCSPAWRPTTRAPGPRHAAPRAARPAGRLAGDRRGRPSWASSRSSPTRPTSAAFEVGQVEAWTAETPRLYDRRGRLARGDGDGPRRLPRRCAIEGDRFLVNGGARHLPRRQPARDPPGPGPRLRRGARPRGHGHHEAAQRERDPHQPLPAAPAGAGPGRRARLLGHRRVRPGDARLRVPGLAGQPVRRPALDARPTWTASSGPSSGTRTTRAS